MFTLRNSEEKGTRSCRREPLDRRWQRGSLLSTCLCLLCFTTIQMKKAVITSITDSSYLTEILLSQRYVVYGIIQRSGSFDRDVFVKLTRICTIRIRKEPKIWDASRSLDHLRNKEACASG